MFDHTVWMMLDGMCEGTRGQLRTTGAASSWAIQQEMLDFICTHRRRLKETSPRTAYELAAARRDDPWALEEGMERATRHREALWNG